MKAIKKPVKIILIVLASLVVLMTLGYAILYLNVNAVRFDYVSDSIYSGANVDINELQSSGYSIEFPFFANKMLLSNGALYTLPFGIRNNNLKVYSSINNPIKDWAAMTAHKYDNRVHIGYEVENDGKTLSVKLKGTAENGEETVPVEKLFVFNIENASPDNLPAWTNYTETDNEFYQL